MQSAITHRFAGVPVSDLDTSIDWYTRFFGRPAASRPTLHLDRAGTEASS